MKNITFTKYLTAAFAALGFTTVSMAADISHSLRNNTDATHTAENYFELGVSAYTGKGPSLTEDESDISGAGIVINGSYNWQGLFIDLYGESQTPLVIGYNAYNSRFWSFDVLLTPTGNGVGEDLDDRFVGIEDRDASIMAGLRATGYIGGYTTQLSVKRDIAGSSRGTMATALVGKNWQYRNWNFHSMIGVNYIDAKFVDYYLGVSEDEANRTQFTAFEGESKVVLSAEVGVTYPVNENWVFRATTHYGNALGDDPKSPLLANDRSDAISVTTSISYVF
jgi:outer membrane scaffolding protein for murein synthesis (MipA/OmpV family)